MYRHEGHSYNISKSYEWEQCFSDFKMDVFEEKWINELFLLQPEYLIYSPDNIKYHLHGATFLLGDCKGKFNFVQRILISKKS